MRIVLDTNVLVSALITKGSPPDLLDLKAVRGTSIVTPRQALERMNL